MTHLHHLVGGDSVEREIVEVQHFLETVELLLQAGSHHVLRLVPPGEGPKIGLLEAPITAGQGAAALHPAAAAEFLPPRQIVQPLLPID